jgi:RHS repeat-associated protein
MRMEWSPWNRGRRALRLGAAQFLSLLLLVCATVGVRAGDEPSRLPVPGAPATAIPGQSLTLLPDGRWMRVGGSTLQAPQTTIALEQGSAQETFPAQLQLARSGHTATVLPDGRVLILGGIGPDGVVISGPEVIDAVQGTVEALPSTRLTPRTQHSATLLTDGEVLIVGGRDSEGNVLSTAELFNPRTLTVQSTGGGLQIARFAQEAALLANGEGLVWGGQSSAGQALSNGEVYRPNTQLFEGPVGKADTRVIELSSAKSLPPNVADTFPGTDATDVPLDVLLGIRFTKTLPIAQLNAQRISLIGPSGAVPGSVVGAERGMLAFFTPSQQLTPGTTYTLFVSGLADESGRTLPLTTVRFTTLRIIAPPTTSAATTASTDASAKPVTRQNGPSSVTRSTSTSNPTSQKAQTTAPAQQPEPTPDTTATPSAEDWVPRVENRHGAWRVLGYAGDPPMSKPAVIALSAAPNRSAVSGMVRRLNGQPLADVSISIGAKTTKTDSQGRFLLSNAPTGDQQLKVDGRSVSSGGRHYTEHYLHVKVNEGSATSIPDPIYLPRVDPATEVPISSPADREIVLTHPAIPGLEVRIPKGAVLRERDGTVVTKVSITPIPVDRAPYPAPTPFSVYFTLQPGGAYVDGDPSKALKINYPNYLKLAPGTSVNFWNYDPTAGGWQIYGHGRVTPNGNQVIADESVGFRQIMTFGFGLGSNNPLPPSGGTPDGCKVGDPIDCSTGIFTHVMTDLTVTDVIPISVTRVYRTNDNQPRTVGVGSNLSYDMWLYTPPSGTSGSQVQVTLVRPDGSRISFPSANSNGIGPPYSAAPTPTAFGGAIINIDETYQQWVLTMRDGTVLRFDGPTQINQLASITDRHGNQVTVSHLTTNTSGAEANVAPISKITSPNGRYIQLFYDSYNRLNMTMDNAGRETSYQYDNLGRLMSATDAAGNSESYSYDPVSNNMSVITDKRGNTATRNIYDQNGRVTQQTLADGTVWRLAYTLDNNGNVTQATITDPRGYVRQHTFDASGYPTQSILALGQPEQQTFTIVHNSWELPISITDALGRKTIYGYDSAGDVTSVIALYGTSNATRYTLGYDPTFHQLTSVTDPLGHTMSITMDTLGNAARLRDPLGNQTSISYNSQGLPTAITDALGNITQFAYSSQGDLSGITDPLNRRGQFVQDNLGRLIAASDPLGNFSQFGLDVLDRVTSVVNPQGGMTTLDYDSNGNLLSATDPNSVTQTFTYDARDRRHTYQDPSGNTATYNFDGMDNLTSILDRKGQTTTITYDGLSRPTLITYQDGSTITITWDAGNRPTQLVDSVNGTLSRTYDLLDRLTQETSPQGQVSYTYDAASRRATTTVGGQPAINYTFDDANRLTQVAQGATILAFGYDAAGRRTSVTLPNGVVGTFGFDAASQLISIAYANGATALGNLVYGYDSDGRRNAMSGSLAGFVAPTVVPSMAYDGSNRLTSWAGTPLSYDANGNITAFGSATYTWNARNQLVATSAGAGAGAGSFSYDALGRRTGASVNGVLSAYVYDGPNPVMMGGNLMLGTPSIDDQFAQVGASATTGYLRDGLGSAIGETGSAGTLAASYFYSPYGDSVNTSAAPTPFQFTGRENDGPTGLYYYRARYYSPQLGRFISEDPLGLAAGTNFYAYVDGDPISETDPEGEFGVVGAAIGGGLDLAIQLMENHGRFSCVNWTSVGLSAVAGALTGGLADSAFAWKAGSNTWGATRKWLANDVWDLAKGQHVHHWFIERNSAFGKAVPDWIKNQPWNLNPMPSNAWHSFLHAIDPVSRTLLGAPGWAQGTAVGTGVAIAGAGGPGCGCN